MERDSYYNTLRLSFLSRKEEKMFQVEEMASVKEKYYNRKLDVQEMRNSVCMESVL